MFRLLMLVTLGVRWIDAQHLMPVAPQRVVVNNFAPGPPQGPAQQPQFRIVQTFNGPFRILNNPAQNTNGARPPSIGSGAFQQPQATHQFNTAAQNPFSHPRPVITTFRHTGTVQQGLLRVPSHQVLVGPSQQSLQGPAHQTLQGHAHQTLVGPPARQTLQGPSHQTFQGPSHHILQAPSHHVLQRPSDQATPGIQHPQNNRPSAQGPAFTFQNQAFQNRNQPFNPIAFQQQQVHKFRQEQTANGFFTNPFPSTTQTNFPFHVPAPTLPPRLPPSPGPRPFHSLGNGFPPNSGETSTSPTSFREPIQQNFQRPEGFSSEMPISSEHFGPTGPPHFDSTTARFGPGNPSGQNFQAQQHNGPPPGFFQVPPFTGSPVDFNLPERQQSFVPQTSTEFQGPFSTNRPEITQNLNFPESFEFFPENGLTGSRERFPSHGSNFPSSVEFPRAPISFFGQGFTGFSDPPPRHSTFNSLESGQEETSSEIPQHPISPSTEPPKQTTNSQEIQPASLHTSSPPTPGHLIQNQFTSEELKPEVLKVTDDDRKLLQSLPTTPSFPTEAPTSQQKEPFNGHLGTLTSAEENPSTTAISSETFPDTNSRETTQTIAPDGHDQQGIRIETPTQRTTSPVTHSQTLPETSSESTEAAIGNESTVMPGRKPQSPSFAAILNNLQQPPTGEDQLQRPQPSRGTVKHSKVPLRRTTRIRRIRTTTRRPTPTADPQQELQTEQQRNSPQVVPDEFHRIPSSPPVLGGDAKVCNPNSCQLPNCFCGGNQIPGGLKPTEVPQMVLLTFDDSVNEINYGFYSSLLNEGRSNPNGCPISGTFYVSHEWTDYGKIQTLYALGHEIASHSISHSDGASFTKERWNKEIDGQKRILSALGKVRLEDIKGMRAPFLQGGGNKQFAMLYEANFTYDSSIPANLINPPTWPYTLDYRMPHECGIPPCPNKAFPGVWEVPMVMWEDLNGGKCAMADACHNPSDARGVYDMLVKNFKRHYTTNRAPFGMFYHYAWFTHPHQQEGFLAFIDALNKLPDVYFVTNSQMLDWVRSPTPLSRIKDFKPWHCKSFLADTCSAPKQCTYRFKGDERQFPTCQPCPEKYPWLETYDSLRVTT